MQKEQILLRTDCNTKIGKNPFKGPFDIVKDNDNGTIQYWKKHIVDMINIQNVQPFRK